MYVNQTSKLCLSCPQGLVFSSQSFKCQCPIEKPYMNKNKECIPCFFPKYFNYGTKTCD